MKINYLPNIEAGSKIDLSKQNPEKRKLNTEALLIKLKSLLAHQADQYNKKVGDNWLDEQGAIRMFNYHDKERDEELVVAQEEQWAQESGKSREKWLEDKEKNPANLTEMALTLMLQKLLPDRFMIVRSSVYDDYNHGVDQLILDRESGEVICGIDEVIERSYYNGPSKKEEKIEKQMLKGGFQVKYGAKFVNGALSLQSLRNIPAFYLALKKEDLDDLVESLASDQVSEKEIELLNKLKQSLTSQAEKYAKLDLHPVLRRSIEKFSQFLDNFNI
jgi:hypothetical protein